MKLIECVPNFSEGQDRAIIDAIAQAIRSAAGVTLLDVDPGADTNRTVYTFIGPPQAVAEGAYRGIALAAERIDMRKHRGAHARIGACDVCPLVPVREVTMEECVELARALGKRVAEELHIPVYLYQEAASRPERRNLATIRRGEYEGLAEKFKDPAWRPDFGRPALNPKSGATVIGAREFLIAFNFNLDTRDKKIAQEIAQAIRQSGRKGKPGKFMQVKAVGWYLEELQRTQVSMNLTDYRKTPLAEVFDEVCRQAEARGVRCTGSELVGLIPKECLLEAGRHFLRKAGKDVGLPEPELIRLAVQSLGLSELRPFDPEKKIIDYLIPDPQPLPALSLKGFVDEISSDSPAPGGGSAAALCGALASALARMVAGLTVGRKGYEQVWDQMQRLADQAQTHQDLLVRAVDDDTAAFQAVLAARRQQRQTDEQRAARLEAIQRATRGAIEVPLGVLRRVREVIDLVEGAATHGNSSCRSDSGVAGACARAAAQGAYYNVLVNLSGFKDKAQAANWLEEAGLLAKETLETADRVAKFVEDHLAER